MTRFPFRYRTTMLGECSIFHFQTQPCTEWITTCCTTFFGSIKARHNVKLEVYQGFLSVPGWSDQLNFHVNIVVFNKPWIQIMNVSCLGRTSTGNLWKGFIISGLSRTISLNIRSQHVFFVINHTDSCGRGALLQTGFLIIHCRPCAFWRRCQTPAKMMLTLCWWPCWTTRRSLCLMQSVGLISLLVGIPFGKHSFHS